MFKGANYIKTKSALRRAQNSFGYDAAKVLEVSSDGDLTVYFYDFKIFGEKALHKNIIILADDALCHFLESYRLHSIDGVEEIEEPNEHAEDNKFLIGILTARYKTQKELAEALGVSPTQITRWIQGEKMPAKRIKQCKDITKGIKQ